MKILNPFQKSEITLLPSGHLVLGIEQGFKPEPFYRTLQIFILREM